MDESYLEFSDRLPAQREFWRSMEEAERRHVAMIRELREYLPSRKALVAEGKVRAAAVKSFLSYVESVLRRTRSEGILPEKALSLSVDIENSLVEKGMLGHFLGASPEANAVLDRLKAESAEHLAKTSEMLAEVRRSAGTAPHREGGA